MNRRAGTAFLLLAASFSFLMGCNRSPEIYIANGGLNYLVLQERPGGELEVKATTLQGMGGPGKLVAERHGDELHLTTFVNTGAELTKIVDVSTSFSSTLHLQRETDGDGYDLLKITYRWGGPESVTLYENRPKYLHLVDSPGVVDYYEGAAALALGQETDATSHSLVELTSELLREKPDDLYYRFLHLDSLLRSERWEILLQRLHDWKRDFENAAGEALLQDEFTRLLKVGHWLELEKSGRNGDDLRRELLDPQNDLQKKMQLLQQFTNYETAVMRPSSIGDELVQEKRPDFLQQQVLVKIARVTAVFRLLEGKRDEALAILAGSYRHGQLLTTEAVEIHRMIAAALRMIASAGLEQYMLNVCENEEDFQQFWRTLDELYRVEKMRRSVPAEVAEAGGMIDSVGEWEPREKTADARFELLRTATAARLRKVTTGGFPQTAADFAPLLPEGLPLDPFTSHPLRFIPGEPFRIYSVGPDRIDNQASFVYDPTNGTLSAGDITMSIPEKRTYPFPREPLRASTRDDVLRVFPNGLPADPFSDRRSGTLRVTSSTPVLIYSVGPDTDDIKIRPIEQTYVPTVQYDPTNGTVSKGDLFYEVPPVR